VYMAEARIAEHLREGARLSKPMLPSQRPEG
jgi:hypothetical protein